MLKVRAIRWLTVGLAALLLSTAFAAYRSENDVRIGIDGKAARFVARLLPIQEVGDVMFETQEGTHDLLKQGTGAEVDHYYIRIGIGGEEIPVDPFEFHR